ncbi:MAG TPA: hypothetical protein VJW76_14935 [Verrucomicrobiae bacterium]|nr:hypothetical protein [Verrucomicrobiae bacterium]
MKKTILRIAIVLVVLLVVAVVASFFFLGSIIKKGVETVGPQITKTEMRLDGASLSVFSGSGTLKGLFVGNPEGYKTESAMKFGSTSVGVKPGSIFSDKIHVTHVNVQAPEITFEGGLKGNNLSKLLDNVQSGSSGGGATSAGTAESSAASKKIQVDDFLISGGKIHLSIDVPGVGAKSATVPLPEIHLTGLGQGADGITAAELTKIILKEVLQRAIPAAEKAAMELGKGLTDAAKDLSKDPAGTVDKATKGLGDLLKKKN